MVETVGVSMRIYSDPKSRYRFSHSEMLNNSLGVDTKFFATPSDAIVSYVREVVDNCREVVSGHSLDVYLDDSDPDPIDILAPELEIIKLFDLWEIKPESTRKSSNDLISLFIKCVFWNSEVNMDDSSDYGLCFVALDTYTYDVIQLFRQDLILYRFGGYSSEVMESQIISADLTEDKFNNTLFELCRKRTQEQKDMNVIKPREEGSW